MPILTFSDCDGEVERLSDPGDRWSEIRLWGAGFLFEVVANWRPHRISHWKPHRRSTCPLQLPQQTVDKTEIQNVVWNVSQIYEADRRQQRQESKLKHKHHNLWKFCLLSAWIYCKFKLITQVGNTLQGLKPREYSSPARGPQSKRSYTTSE